MQLDLINRFNGFWNTDVDSSEYGTVTAENLVRILADPAIRMRYAVRAQNSWDASFVESKLSTSPVLLAYREPEVDGFHVSIIHSLNGTTTGDVNVMDPNRGRFRTRSHRFLTTGDYLLSWAA